MQGREEIEWKDRSWRLLANQGQVEADNWILEGGAVGAGAAIIASRTGKLPSGLESRLTTAALGGTGLGAAGGTAAYLLWQYGVKGGKFE
jgi:hypothetical protein